MYQGRSSVWHAYLILKDYVEFVPDVVVGPPLKRHKMIGGLRRERGDLILRIGNGTVFFGTHVVLVHDDTVYDCKPGEINHIEECVKICRKYMFNQNQKI